MIFTIFFFFSITALHAAFLAYPIILLDNALLWISLGGHFLNLIPIFVEYLYLICSNPVDWNVSKSEIKIENIELKYCSQCKVGVNMKS
jgi:hypothetical protein